MPSNVHGTTSRPNNITSQCTGRTNSVSLLPQRIRFAIGNESSADSTRGGRRSTVSAPDSVPRKRSQVPLDVSIRSSSETSTPQLLAKASAARIGAPSASNAAFTGGPRRSTLRSGCLSGNCRARTASRRGVAKVSIARYDRPASSRPWATPRANASASTSRDLGGNSSVPTSTRKSFLLTPMPLRRSRRQPAAASESSVPLDWRNRLLPLPEPAHALAK